MSFLKWLYTGISGDGFCNDWLGHMHWNLGKFLYEISGCGTRMSDDTRFFYFLIPFIALVCIWNLYSLVKDVPLSRAK